MANTIEPQKQLAKFGMQSMQSVIDNAKANGWERVEIENGLYPIDELQAMIDVLKHIID